MSRLASAAYLTNWLLSAQDRYRAAGLCLVVEQRINTLNFGQCRQGERKFMLLICIA